MSQRRVSLLQPNPRGAFQTPCCHFSDTTKVYICKTILAVQPNGDNTAGKKMASSWDSMKTHRRTQAYTFNANE